MSDEDFWDIDQYQTTRRNREIGANRVVDPVRSAAETRAYDAAAEHVEPVEWDLPDQRRRERRQPRDIAEIHGLDETQIGGNVRDALADLIREIGLLTEDLRFAEGRIDYLENEIRHDRLGDWFDRQGFLGQLAHLSTLDEQEHTHSSLVLVSLDAFAEMRRHQGWATADDVIIDLGVKLMQIPDAVVGHLADNLFGLLLAGTSSDAVASAIDKRVPPDISIPGDYPKLPVRWAASEIRQGQGGLTQISALERKLARQDPDAAERG